MVALTYGASRVPAADAAAAPRKSFFARLLDAMMAARMQQARREIRLYTRLMPFTVDEHGNRKLKTETNDMPFGGW